MFGISIFSFLREISMEYISSFFSFKDYFQFLFSLIDWKEMQSDFKAKHDSFKYYRLSNLDWINGLEVLKAINFGFFDFLSQLCVISIYFLKILFLEFVIQYTAIRLFLFKLKYEVQQCINFWQYISKYYFIIRSKN